MSFEPRRHNHPPPPPNSWLSSIMMEAIWLEEAAPLRVLFALKFRVGMVYVGFVRPYMRHKFDNSTPFTLGISLVRHFCFYIAIVWYESSWPVVQIIDNVRHNRCKARFPCVYASPDHSGFGRCNHPQYSIENDCWLEGCWRISGPIRF